MKNTTRIFALLLALFMAFSVVAMTGCGDAEANNSGDETQQESKETETPKKEESNKSNSDFVGVDWVNALEAGFVGDGKTPNDEAFAVYAKRNTGKPLYFPKGVYCFEETLNFPYNMCVKMDPGAELKCIAKERLEYFITLRGQHQDDSDAWCSWMEYAQGASIDGGTINCDYKANCALGLFQGMNTDFRNFKILNVMEKGIQTLISETTDGCYNFTNVAIYNSAMMTGTVGVYDNGYDNHFSKVSACNFETGFYTKGGRFNECSAWNLDTACMENCTFAYVEGNQSVWYNPSVDTVRYGFRFAPNASASIIDMLWITNAVFYTDALQAKYPRTMFYCEGNALDSRVMVMGLQFSGENNLAFSNVEMPNAVFMNVRAPYTLGTTEIANFRNDTERLLAMADGYEAEKTGNLTAGSNFDELTEAGIYSCELRVGQNGKNVPPVKEVGMLEVEVVGKTVVQRFTGTSTSLLRIYDGTSWSAWRS